MGETARLALQHQGLVKDSRTAMYMDSNRASDTLGTTVRASERASLVGDHKPCLRQVVSSREGQLALSHGVRDLRLG